MRLSAIYVVVLFAATGLMLLFYTHAATPTVSVEPELGTLTTHASLVSDSSASGNGAIRFNTPSQQIGSGPVDITGNWTMKFDDEFSGTSRDTSKWAPYWFSNGAQSNGTAMNSSNVTESSGYLNLAVSGALAVPVGSYRLIQMVAQVRVISLPMVRQKRAYICLQRAMEALPTGLLGGLMGNAGRKMARWTSWRDWVELQSQTSIGYEP